MHTIDFETYPIEDGSPRSPSPVSVAIKRDTDVPMFYNWGHPDGDNRQYQAATAYIQSIWTKNEPILCHNAKFDIRVAMEEFSLPWPVGPVHDTMLLAYLVDPRAKSLKLKDLAKVYLDREPVEQADLRDWLTTHVKKATKRTFMKYVAHAPGEIIRPYAVADADMTHDLFHCLIRVLEDESERRIPD